MPCEGRAGERGGRRGGLRLRNASSTDAAVLETIPDGSQIEVSGITESGWYQVSFQDTQAMSPPIM